MQNFEELEIEENVGETKCKDNKMMIAINDAEFVYSISLINKHIIISLTDANFISHVSYDYEETNENLVNTFKGKIPEKDVNNIITSEIYKAFNNKTLKILEYNYKTITLNINFLYNNSYLNYEIKLTRKERPMQNILHDLLEFYKARSVHTEEEKKKFKELQRVIHLNYKVVKISDSRKKKQDLELANSIKEKDNTILQLRLNLQELSQKYSKLQFELKNSENKNITDLISTENIESKTDKDWQERTKLLLGSQNINILHSAHILICGVGGVGGYAAENLVRAGIGELTLIDSDKVSISNINRQIIATTDTLNLDKIDVISQRLKKINPELKLHTYKTYITEDNAKSFLTLSHFDYVIDAIDTLAPKVNVIKSCIDLGIKVVSAMGAGAKIDPTFIKIDDISKSYQCQLATEVRKMLRKIGVEKGVKVVFSGERAKDEAVEVVKGEQNKKSICGTISYMPSIFGCFCASVVIRDLIVF